MTQPNRTTPGLDTDRAVAPVAYSTRLGAASNRAAWEAGCASDLVRNAVVIPHLSRLISACAPRSIADIGCGTGYVARALLRDVELRVTRWVLVDVDAKALDFAAAAVGGAVQAATVRLDMTQQLAEPLEWSVDFAFSAFMLPEFRMTSTVGQNLARVLAPGGHLVVYLPDCLADVRFADRAGIAALEEYESGHCALHKMDRFTKRRYAFHANRIEWVISALLSAGLRLVALDVLPRPDRDEPIFCLHLVREQLA